MIQKFVRHPFALIARLTAFLTIIGAMALMSGLVVAQVVQPDLLTATSFSVLAGTTVTNTGATIIGPPVGSPALGGDLGVHPGSSVTNFPPGFVLPPGVIHAADAVALQAKSDLTATYLSIAGITPCAALPASIGTLTVTPGVYCFTSDVLFTTPSTGLTLDLQGNADSLFIFQIPGQLTTQSGYAVTFINGSAPCNVWWQVGSSATLDTSTQFVGNILALTSISLATGTTMSPGRALARNGAVTLDTSTLNMSGCLTAPATSTPTRRPTRTPTNTPTPLPPPTATPTPSLPVTVTSLPLTGEHPDNRLPLAIATGLIALAMGGLLVFKRGRAQ